MQHFKQFDVPDFTFKEAIKKPVKIKCIRMEEAFTVETLEGTMQGKAGDWLMVGVSGELYPCANDIFEKSYDIIE